MGIKRNEVAEPQWMIGDYPLKDDGDLFSNELWKANIEWDVLLEHIKKTESVCQLITQNIYPSRLFFAYIDILEANLYVFDDLFYFLTGTRVGNAPDFNIMYPSLYGLRFWNLDYHKEINLIYEGLNRIEEHFAECLKQQSLSEIADEVIKNSRNASELISFGRISYEIIFRKDRAYKYAGEAYKELNINKNTLVNQIVNILNFLKNHKNIFSYFNSTIHLLSFNLLLLFFRQSEKGQNFIKPWKRDLMGSRDSLIVKMEKDPELGQWVNRYTHRREDKSIIKHLFCDENGYVKNEEEAYNTDNWIRILTIAAILLEYDEQQNAVVEKSEEEKGEETLLLKLSLYFKGEDVAMRFLEKVRQLNTTEIIDLVKKYRDAGLCTDTSKNLWKVLHDANLYTPLYKNWNAQINKR
jgi:hypothetical protein